MKRYLVDTTLRDGEQAPGVMFNIHHKLHIARLLDALGVEELEVGTPAMGIADQVDIKTIASSGFKFKTTAWCRARIEDIDAAAECKTDAVSISFPVSQIQLSAIGKDWLWVEKTLPFLVDYARMCFKYVYVGFQDATRCDMEKLKKLIMLANASGVDRIRIADTVGIMNPATTANLFSALSATFPSTDFEFHGHNDLGMATANAFMALENGASGVSCTVNGLGERAGNTALEELLMAMRLDEKGSHYHTPILNELSHYVEQVSKQKLALSKPIVGEQVFTHETGIHVNSLLKNKMTYQAFDESLVGIKSNKIVIGKHSGRHAYANFYASKGIQLKEQELEKVYHGIQHLIYTKGCNPSEGQMLKLYKEILG